MRDTHFPFSLSMVYLICHGFTLSANFSSSLLLLCFPNYSNGQAHGPTPRCCCGGGGGVVLLVLPAMQGERPARNTPYPQSLGPRCLVILLLLQLLLLGVVQALHLSD